MILATKADRRAVEQFLMNRAPFAMFPLSNLARYGMDGGHRRAMRFWVRWQAGQITDVIAVSEEGMVFPVCTTGPWADFAAVMAGATVKGLIGAAEQVQACRAALGLRHQAAIDTTEPSYSLPLDRLVIPQGQGLSLHPLGEAPLDLLIAWRTAFCVESLSTEPAAAAERAVHDIDDYLAHDTHRVLMDQGVPVAMTGFNAVLPQVVQIGGVFTPPALRSRGYARQAVALHLLQARATGIANAVLSAATGAAARAYEAIGFARCGSFAIVAYDQPQVIRG